MNNKAFFETLTDDIATHIMFDNQYSFLWEISKNTYYYITTENVYIVEFPDIMVSVLNNTDKFDSNLMLDFFSYFKKHYTVVE